MRNVGTLEELIHEELNDGESVLWSGKPTGIKLLDMPYGSPIIIRWVICLAFIAFALWYRFIYIVAANSGMNGNTIMFVCLIIAIVVAALPLLDIYKLNNKCSYYITDKRALILVKGSTRILKEKKFSDISEITFDIITDNRGNIYIGEKLKNSSSKARVSVLTPARGPEEGDSPLIFHSVTDPADIVDLFPALKAGD